MKLLSQIVSALVLLMLVIFIGLAAYNKYLDHRLHSLVIEKLEDGSLKEMLEDACKERFI